MTSGTPPPKRRKKQHDLGLDGGTNAGAVIPATRSRVAADLPVIRPSPSADSMALDENSIDRTLVMEEWEGFGACCPMSAAVLAVRANAGLRPTGWVPVATGLEKQETLGTYGGRAMDWRQYARRTTPA